MRETTRRLQGLGSEFSKCVFGLLDPGNPLSSLERHAASAGGSADVVDEKKKEASERERHFASGQKPKRGTGFSPGDQCRSEVHTDPSKLFLGAIWHALFYVQTLGTYLGMY